MPVGSAEIIYAFFLVLIEHLFLYIDIFHLYYPLVSAFSHTFQCCRADCSSAYERNNHRHSVGFYNTRENLFRGGWLYSLTILLIGLSFQAI